MPRRTILALALLCAGCSTVGPSRPALVHRASSVEPPHHALALQAAEVAPAAPSEPSKATSFSAGLMVGAGMALDGSRRVLPAQLAVGSCKLLSAGERSISLLALGGMTGNVVQNARPAWGVGASFELTPGTLAYEAAVGTGVLWTQGETAPALILGLTLTPKM